MPPTTAKEKKNIPYLSVRFSLGRALSNFPIKSRVCKKSPRQIGYSIPDKTWIKIRASNEEAQRLTPTNLNIIFGIIIIRINTIGFKSGFTGIFGFAEPEKGIKTGHISAPSATPKKLNRLIMVINPSGTVSANVLKKKLFKIKSK